MHISEGVLTAPVLVSGAALTVAGVAIGLKRVNHERLPQVAIFSAVFFTASLIHVPIGPAAAHLVLNGLCGILLGWMAFPAILVGLVFQALLFQFGGLTTLGVNTFNIAFPAVVMAFALARAVRSSRAATRTVAEFVCGAGSVFLSGVLVAVSLLATGQAFSAVAGVILVSHIPVMVVEGLLTVFIVEFVRRIRPEMLQIGSSHPL
jgi:cobalt/nickel transport system permease protein